jgi:hypothetical protein
MSAKTVFLGYELMKTRFPSGPRSDIHMAVPKKTAVPRDQLTAEMVRRALDYDPETGLLSWRHRDDVLPRVNKRLAGKPAGCPDGQYGYLSVRLHDYLYQAHRLIWLHVTGEWPTAVLDHVDGIPSNNAWNNLRPATRAENNRNRRTYRENGYLKGTAPASKGKWRATIMLGRENHILGTFDSQEEAHAAYVEAAKHLHEQFARFD